MDQDKFQWQMTMIAREHGTSLMHQEFEYFKEYAMKFPDNPPEKRFGIIPQGAKLVEENMLYAEDTPELRLKHLTWIIRNPDGGSVGYQQRKFIDWIEKMEGKQ